MEIKNDMDLTDLRILIEDHFKLNLNTRSREIEYINARCLYYHTAINLLGFNKKKVSLSVGYDRLTVINSLNRFEELYRKGYQFRLCFKKIKIKLGLETEKPKLKIPDLSDQVNEVAHILRDLTDEEIKEFIPRVDIYKKSVMYNRKKKEEWTR